MSAGLERGGRADDGEVEEEDDEGAEAVVVPLGPRAGAGEEEEGRGAGADGGACRQGQQREGRPKGVAQDAAFVPVVYQGHGKLDCAVHGADNREQNRLPRLEAGFLKFGFPLGLESWYHRILTALVVNELNIREDGLTQIYCFHHSPSAVPAIGVIRRYLVASNC